jgi:MATE family multidrug resistance protein
MMLAAVSYWAVGLACSLTLAFVMGMEGAGLWLGFVCALTCAAVLLTGRLRRLARRRHLPAPAPAE